MTRNRLAIGGGLAAVLVAALGFSGWWFLIRDDAPPPVNLAAAVAAAQETATATAEVGSAVAGAATAQPASNTTTSTATATAAEAPPTRPEGELTGVWTLSEQGESFAGYRIQEELARIGGNTAVGRSSAIEATLEFDGSAITNVEIVVDMTALASDDSRRDRQLRTRAIETNDFPTASFVLTEPILLDGVPEDGVPIAATAIGDFTLHGVTRSVEIALEGQLTNGLVVVIGSLDVALADYEIEPPVGLSVLSVADDGVIEFQLIFG